MLKNNSNEYVWLLTTSELYYFVYYFQTLLISNVEFEDYEVK